MGSSIPKAKPIHSMASIPQRGALIVSGVAGGMVLGFCGRGC
jgi:hypothetical protein